MTKVLRFFLFTILMPGVVIFLSLQNVKSQEYAIGADLSFLKSAEDMGFSFKEDGIPKEGLKIFREHGYAWIRLRLFHTPTRLPNNLEYTISLARKAKEKGFKFLLDFHYSDTWADPGKQYTPAAWEGKSYRVLVDSVYRYTRSTMISFREAGVFPEMVQIGNEVINGILWPEGKLPEKWDNFAGLLEAGIKGVYAACNENVKKPLIMIHIDQGGNREKTKWFFDKIVSYGIEFDIIGQSYYPWWHGTLLELRSNMIFMTETYKKPVILVEVAYCSSPTEYKSRPAPFPETPEGQKEFLEEVNKIVLSAPGNLGAGIFWWEPATYGGRSTRDYFDETGNVLPVITVFDRYTRR
ncbi:MAG: glycoside hydrolase family 53 protein [Bacteroidales bacterium]